MLAYIEPTKYASFRLVRHFELYPMSQKEFDFLYEWDRDKADSSTSPVCEKEIFFILKEEIYKGSLGDYINLKILTLNGKIGWFWLNKNQMKHIILC